MRIGELARRAGVPDVERLNVIRHCRSLDMPLAEMAHGEVRSLGLLTDSGYFLVARAMR